MGSNSRTFAALGSALLLVILLAGWGLKSLFGHPARNPPAHDPYATVLSNGMQMPAGMTLPPGMTMPAGMGMPPSMAISPALLEGVDQVAMYKLMAERHLSARAALYLMKSKIKLIEETKTSTHFLMSFPDGGTIDETVTLLPNQSYTPTSADLARAARSGSRVYNPHLSFKKNGTESVMATLEYKVPYSAVPKEILERIGAPVPGTPNQAAGFFNLVPPAWGQTQAIVEPSLGLVTNMLAEHWKDWKLINGELEEFDNLKSLGIDAPLALLDLFLSMKDLAGKMGQIGELEDCAKNPTNPLTQKASKDSNYQHEVLDPLSGAKWDVGSSGLPKVANVGAGYLAHFLPFGGGFLLSPFLAMNDSAIDSINEERIQDAEKAVVPCDKESEMTAFGYRPMTGKVEYKYNEEHRDCSQQGSESGCNHSKTERGITATFEIDPNATEETAAKDVGTGFVQEDSDFTNPKCHGETHSILRGPIKVSPEIGGTPENAIVKIGLGGDMWEGKLDSSQTCGAMPPVHNTWNNGAFGTTCKVTINMVTGGSATAYVEADRGHGTCTVELQGK